MLLVEGPASLALLVQQLALYFPESLGIYHFALEKLNNRFVWPGVEFVVDTFPNFTVAIARTGQHTNDTSAPPFINDVGVYVYSRNPENFRALLDESQSLNWSHRLAFRGINHPVDSEIIGKKCQSMNEEAGFPQRSFSIVTRFDLTRLLSNFTYSLPDGFYLGNLTEKDAEQLQVERPYGVPENNLLFYRYTVKHYPSAAVVEKATGKPVSYIAYRPEGCLGMGYTVPEHRRKGFFKIVCHELLRQLKELGDQSTYALVGAGGASMKAMLAVGGVLYENYTAAGMECVPKNWTNPRAIPTAG